MGRGGRGESAGAIEVPAIGVLTAEVSTVSAPTVGVPTVGVRAKGEVGVAVTGDGAGR